MKNVKKYILFSGLLFLTVNLESFAKMPKVLSLGFHLGCLRDIEEVGKELGLDVTSWYILGADQPKLFFDGVSTGNSVYNVSHNRAKRVWDKHKEWFDQFDIIITSDTAPLSRIFLQNGWKKPLIIWICNRFDYCDGEGRDGFPDREFYDLFNQAHLQSNVRVVGYTPYEHYYARKYKGVETGDFTIKPVGSVKGGERGNQSAIPAIVDKKTTVFIYPRLFNNQLKYAQDQCATHGIKTYSGVYNGPQDLKDFKAVLYFPYAWSNLALFEDAQFGIIHCVPSESFVRSTVRQGLPIRTVTHDLFQLVEWYMPENRDVILYFDSWDDLRNKLETVDLSALRVKAMEFAVNHRNLMMKRWQDVFASLAI